MSASLVHSKPLKKGGLFTLSIDTWCTKPWEVSPRALYTLATSFLTQSPERFPQSFVHSDNEFFGQERGLCTLSIDTWCKKTVFFYTPSPSTPPDKVWILLVIQAFLLKCLRHCIETCENCCAHAVKYLPNFETLTWNIVPKIVLLFYPNFCLLQQFWISILFLNRVFCEPSCVSQYYFLCL